MKTLSQAPSLNILNYVCKEFPVLRTSTSTFSACNVASWPSKRNLAMEFQFSLRSPGRPPRSCSILLHWISAADGSCLFSHYVTDKPTTSMRLPRGLSTLIASTSPRSLYGGIRVCFLSSIQKRRKCTTLGCPCDENALHHPLDASSSNSLSFPTISRCVLLA